MQTLLDGSAQILEAIQNAQKGAAQVSQGLAAIQDNYGTINALEEQNSSASEYLTGLVNMASGMYAALSQEQIEKYAAGVDVNGILGNVSNIAGLLQQNNSAFETVKGGISQAAAGAGELSSGMDTLAGMYEEFDRNIQSLPVLMNR